MRTLKKSLSLFMAFALMLTSVSFFDFYSYIYKRATAASVTLCEPLPSPYTCSKRSSNYGNRTYTYNGETVSDFHTGIDIAAPSNTPIYCVYGGTVIVAEKQSSYGNIVIIEHSDLNLFSVYAHQIDGGICVSVGDKVTKGQMIGHVGKTGTATGNHLHLELRKTRYYGSDINPTPGVNYNYSYEGQGGTPVEPRMWCEDINMPDELILGQSFTLTGKICSNNIVKWYAVVIYDSNNKDFQNKQEAVWRVATTNSYSISGAANQIDFSTLPAGNYRLSIQSMDNDDNYYSAYEKSFSVSAPRMWCEDVNMPDELILGQSYTLTGRICSNNIVKWYAVVIYDSNNKDIQNKQEAVWRAATTNSYSISGAANQIDFSTLPAGNYCLSIQSMDNDDNYYSAYEKSFSVSAPRMWCEDVNMPDELILGKSYTLTGRICSNNIVKWYAVVIYDSNNKDIQNKQEAVWRAATTNSYSISGAANQIDFSTLPAGNYRLSIQSMDNDDNYYSAYEKSFVVKCSQHSYVNTITPPTCTEQGYTTHICSICGDSYIDSYVAASGHSYGAWIKLNDTQHQRVCSRDASHVETALHTWNSGEVTTPATYDAAGEKTFTCTVCGATRTEVIDPIPQPADPDAVITVATVTAQPGKTVDVTVDLTEYAPMSYLLLGLDYNKTVLTLNSVKNGGLFDTLESGANLLLNAGSDIAAGGNLLTLTFTVSEDAEPGDYTVTVTCKQCYNNSEEPLLVKVENGKITVPDVIVGDVNDDEVIDGRDLIRLRKYLANLDEETGESTVEITAGADCTGDGIVDGRDLIRLRKYLANLDENTGISTVELG